MSEFSLPHECRGSGVRSASHRRLPSAQTFLLYRQAFINAQGPRIANKWDEIIGAIPQYTYVGPYEEIRLKE